MKLILNDFAKINKAEILVDGITVIAGENNTGKSTIGKAMFSVFNTITGIDEKITFQRKKEIEQLLWSNLRFGYNAEAGRGIATRKIMSTCSNIARKLLDESNNDNCDAKIVYQLIEEEVNKEIVKVEFDESLQSIVEKLCSIMKLSDETIKQEIITRYFQEIFNKQINALNNDKKKSEIAVEIKDKKIAIEFENNICTNFETDISLIHKAIYIDNPFVIDGLVDYDEFSFQDKFLRELLMKDSNSEIMDGIIESVLTKEKLDEIYSTLNIVVNGNIIINQRHEFSLEQEGFKEPVSFENLSTGLKSFVLLKMLLERGILKEKDVLILDEPEIHLHPQWQVTYAQLIVLLQKHFNLSVIVATHSPYFLDAINLFSIKYDTQKKVNYYLASAQNERVQMEYVTDNIEKIYEKMVSPVQLLDSLRYELNNQ